MKTDSLRVPLICPTFCLAMVASLACITPSHPALALDKDLPLKDLHATMPIVDGHNDLAWQLRMKKLPEEQIRIDQIPEDLHTSLDGLKTGGVGLQYWSAYVPASLDKEGGALLETVRQIDIIHRLIESHPESLAIAASSSDVERIRASGRTASMIGVEGGYSIEGSLAALRMFYKLGVRYMTLTHSQTIFWADSATDLAKHNGLTEFGKKVVAEMNRLGMMVDISHVSIPTMKSALQHSRAPVIASHSSVAALVDHPRNIPDDVLQLIKKNRGVIMINFYSGYVVQAAHERMKEYEQLSYQWRMKYPDADEFKKVVKEWFAKNPMPTGDVSDVVDHIEYVIKKIGIDYVGLGSDFDGIPTLPTGIQHVREFPNISKELQKRGYSQEQIRKILGGNAMRVLVEVEQVAKKLQAEQSESLPATQSH